MYFVSIIIRSRSNSSYGEFDNNSDDIITIIIITDLSPLVSPGQGFNDHT